MSRKETSVVRKEVGVQVGRQLQLETQCACQVWVLSDVGSCSSDTVFCWRPANPINKSEGKRHPGYGVEGNECSRPIGSNRFFSMFWRLANNTNKSEGNQHPGCGVEGIVCSRPIGSDRFFSIMSPQSPTPACGSSPIL